MQLKTQNRFLSGLRKVNRGVKSAMRWMQQRCSGTVKDVRALLSLSSDWSDSVYKAFDPTTAVSARCGPRWRHALVSRDPVVDISYNCEYAQSFI